jgi:hypothetical protein
MSLDPNRPITEQRLFEILSRALPSGTDVDAAFQQMPAPPQVPAPIPSIVTVAAPYVDQLVIENWRSQLQTAFNPEQIGLLRKLIDSDSTGALTDAEILKIQKRVRAS